MSLAVQSGKTWQNRESCTAAKLALMWSGCSFNGAMAQSDLASGAGLIIVSATAPSDTDAVWFDNVLSLVRVYNGSVWVPQSRGIILTNKSGGALIKGDVVVVGTSNDSAFTTTTTANHNIVLGVLGEAIANDAAGVVITRGLAQINLSASGGATRNFVGTSTSAGKGLGSATATAGQFATCRPSGSGAESVIGFLFGQAQL